MNDETDRASRKSDQEIETTETPVQERQLYRDASLQSADYILEDPELRETVLSALKCSVVLNAQEMGYSVLFVSDPLLKRVGRKKQDVVGRRWDILFDAETDRDVLDEICDRLQARRPASGIVLLRCSEGEVLQAMLCLVPVFDHNRHITHFFGCFATVDAACVQLDSSLEQWRRQVEKALEAVVTSERQNDTAVILSTNAGFETLTGFRHCEVFRAPPDGLWRSADTTQIWTPLCKAQDPNSVTTTLYRKDGAPFQALICSFPLALSRDNMSPGCLHVFIDVTARKPEKLGAYILGRTIGSGASGVVRVAKTINTDETVAVKVVDAAKFRSISEIELIQDEISTLSTVKHEHIVNLREVLFENNIFYFVMDFCSGGSLANHMRSREERFLPECEARDMFQQVISAVAYCHRRRVIHRDLKPENILLDGNGRIQVADFGLSAIAAPCGSLTSLCGTPEFLAPEVISSTEYDGEAADIWSLGIILHELLTGRTPFNGNSRASLFKAIQSGSLALMPDTLSTSCKDLVSRMLIKDPEQRISMEAILSHAWMAHTTKDSQDPPETMSSLGHSPTKVHESARLTLGDWGGNGMRT